MLLAQTVALLISWPMDAAEPSLLLKRYPCILAERVCVLQDLPDGNFRDVKRAGIKKEGKGHTLKAIWCAAR